MRGSPFQLSAFKSHPSRLAVLVSEGWQEAGSGVITFLRVLYGAWKDDPNCSFVEIPMFPVREPDRTETSDVCSTALVTEMPEPYAADSVAGKLSQGIRLALGYSRELVHQCRLLWRVRKQLSGSVLMVNEFGCETWPPALRLLFPAATVVSIAHTHPGQDAAAMHPVRRAIERLCYLSVNDIVFNSNAAKDEWARKLGKRQIKGAVVRHGIPEACTQIPADYPRKPDGVIDFLYVAYFYSWKGQLNCLRMWGCLPEALRRRARLIFVGDGACLAEAKAVAAKRCPGDRVLFLGGKPDAASYFNGCDVALHLPTEPEAFGLVLLEAMVRHKPVIASRLGGICEVVDHGETGLLVDPHDATEVAGAIERMIESPELRAGYGQRGCRRWQTHFTEERMLKEYRDFFSFGKGTTEPPVKIAIASSGLGHVARGIETWAKDTAKALAVRGVDVTLFAGAPGISAFSLHPSSLPVTALPCARRGKRLATSLARMTPPFLWRWGLKSNYGWEQFTFWLSLWPKLVRGKFDILHVQDPMVAFWCRKFRRLGLVRAKEILAHGTEEPLEFLEQFECVQHLAPWHEQEARRALRERIN